VYQPAAIATCKTGNRRTQKVTEAAVVQNRNYSAEGTCGRQHRGQQGGRSSENTQYLIDHLPLFFIAPITSTSSKHHNKKQEQFSGHNTHQNTNQTTGQCKLNM
jgi:hypothetical protein